MLKWIAEDSKDDDANPQSTKAHALQSTPLILQSLQENCNGEQDNLC